MTVSATPAVSVNKIRVGIVGAGTWAEYGHIPSLALLPEFELTAVYSRSADKAQALAARHGIAYPVTSLQALVEHPEVDLVLVLNQAPQHDQRTPVKMTDAAIAGPTVLGSSSHDHFIHSRSVHQ